MLEIRPNCEYCDKDLLPESLEAMICTYECTFCKTCVDEILSNVCPNCGGGFCQRPVRPKTTRREGVGLQHQLASTIRINTQFSLREIREFSQTSRDIDPVDR
jgi:hypothetical protein